MFRRRMRISKRLGEARPLALLEEYGQCEDHVSSLGPLITGVLLGSAALQELVKCHVDFTWDECVTALHSSSNTRINLMSRPYLQLNHQRLVPTLPSLLLSAVKHVIVTQLRLKSKVKALSEKWAHRIVYFLKSYRQLNTLVDLHSYFQYHLIEGLLSALFDCSLITDDQITHVPVNVLVGNPSSPFPWRVIEEDPSVSLSDCDVPEFTLHFPEQVNQSTTELPDVVWLDVNDTPIGYRLSSLLVFLNGSFCSFYRQPTTCDWEMVVLDDLTDVKLLSNSDRLTIHQTSGPCRPISVTYAALNHETPGLRVLARSHTAAEQSSSDEAEEDDFPKYSNYSNADISNELMSLLAQAGIKLKDPLEPDGGVVNRDSDTNIEDTWPSFLPGCDGIPRSGRSASPGTRLAHFRFYDHESMNILDLGYLYIKEASCLSNLNTFAIAKVNELKKEMLEKSNNLFHFHVREDAARLYSDLLESGSNTLETATTNSSKHVGRYMVQTIDTLRLLASLRTQLLSPEASNMLIWFICSNGTESISTIDTLPQKAWDIGAIQAVNQSPKDQPLEFLIQVAPNNVKQCSVCGRGVPIELLYGFHYKCCSEVCEAVAVLANEMRSMVPLGFIASSGNMFATAVPELISVAAIGNLAPNLELLGHYQLAGYTPQGRAFWDLNTALGKRRLIYNSQLMRWEILGSLAVDTTNIKVPTGQRKSRMGPLAYTQRSIISAGSCESIYNWKVCHTEDTHPVSLRVPESRTTVPPTINVFCHSKVSLAPSHIILGCGVNGILGVYQKLRVTTYNAPFYIRASEHATHDYFCRTTISFDSHTAMWRLTVPTVIGVALVPSVITGCCDVLASSSPTPLSTDPTMSSWGPKSRGSNGSIVFGGGGFTLSAGGAGGSNSNSRFAIESIPHESLWRPFVLTVQSEIPNFPSGEYLLPRNAMDATLHFAASPESGVDEHIVHPRILLRILDLVGHLICLAPATHNIHDSFLIKLHHGTRENGFWKSAALPNSPVEARIIAMTELPSALHVFGNGAAAALRGTYYLISCLFNFRPVYVRLEPGYANKTFSQLTPITPEFLDSLCGGNEVAANNLRHPLVFHYYSSTSETWRFGTKAGSGMACCESGVITTVHHAGVRTVRDEEQVSLEETIEEIHELWKHKNLTELKKGTLTASTNEKGSNRKNNAAPAYNIDIGHALEFRSCETDEKMDMLIACIPHDLPVSTRRIVTMLSSPLAELCAEEIELSRYEDYADLGVDDNWETTSCSSGSHVDDDLSEDEWKVPPKTKTSPSRSGGFARFNTNGVDRPKLWTRGSRGSIQQSAGLTAEEDSYTSDSYETVDDEDEGGALPPDQSLSFASISEPLAADENVLTPPPRTLPNDAQSEEKETGFKRNVAQNKKGFKQAVEVPKAPPSNSKQQVHYPKSAESDSWIVEDVSQRLNLSLPEKRRLGDSMFYAFLEIGQSSITTSEFAQVMQKTGIFKQRIKQLKNFVGRHFPGSSPFSVLLKTVCDEWLVNEHGIVSMRSTDQIAEAFFRRFRSELKDIPFRELGSKVPFLNLLLENRSAQQELTRIFYKNELESLLPYEATELLLLYGQEAAVQLPDAQVDRCLEGSLDINGRIRARKSQNQRILKSNQVKYVVSKWELFNQRKADERVKKEQAMVADEPVTPPPPPPPAAAALANKGSVPAAKEFKAATKKTPWSPSTVTPQTSTQAPPPAYKTPSTDGSSVREVQSVSRELPPPVLSTATYYQRMYYHPHMSQEPPVSAAAPPRQALGRTVPQQKIAETHINGGIHPGWVTHPCVRPFISVPESSQPVVGQQVSTEDCYQLYESSSFKGMLLPRALLKHKKAVGMLYNLIPSQAPPRNDILVMTSCRDETRTPFDQKVGVDLSISCKPAMLERLRNIWHD